MGRRLLGWLTIAVCLMLIAHSARRTFLQWRETHTWTPDGIVGLGMTQEEVETLLGRAPSLNSRTLFGRPCGWAPPGPNSTTQQPYWALWFVGKDRAHSLKIEFDSECRVTRAIYHPFVESKGPAPGLLAEFAWRLLGNSSE